MDVTDSDSASGKTHSVRWRRPRLTIVGVDCVRSTGSGTAAHGAARLPEAAPVAELSRYAVPY